MLMIPSPSPSAGRFTNVAVSNEHYYKEESLIKKAAQFAATHTDIGPLNNMFTNKTMIKNKLNQVKFPHGYLRDGNDMMQPYNRFNTQQLELKQLNAMLNIDDHQAKINQLKKHHYNRVMYENNQGTPEIMREKIVSSGSARDGVDSQGTTGILNIIDQNSGAKATSSSHIGGDIARQ